MPVANMPNLDNYLRSHNAVKGEGFTHTRMPGTDNEQTIFGGSYNIPDNEWADFMKTYHHHVFVNGNDEFLTEKQLIENGPLLIDIDLRYPLTVTTRQHSKEYIVDAVMLYAEKIGELFDIPDNAKIEVLVMEKDSVNRLVKKNLTKDGIHMIFFLQMHKGMQVLLRNKVLPDLKEIWEGLPITNTWEDVLDNAVTKGSSPWQLYGSRKPEHQAYKIKQHIGLTFEPGEGWTYEEYPLQKFSIEKNILRCSARYTEHPSFPIKAEMEEEFEAAKLTLSQSSSNSSGGSSGSGDKKYNSKFKGKLTDKSKGGKGGKGNDVAYSDISNKDELDEILINLFDNISPSDYKLKEAHDYTMSLPASFYGPNSYTNWLNVGMALHNTDTNHGFPIWLCFSAQADTFDWREVPDLYRKWQGFSDSSAEHRLAFASIMYWSKHHAVEKYNDIRKNTVSFFVNQTTQTATDYDLAIVLHQMYKDKYVCTNIKNAIWYQYKNHRWRVIDSGYALRNSISEEMHKIYNTRLQEIGKKNKDLENSDGATEADLEKGSKLAKKLAEICIKLRSVTSKNNIMREACEVFMCEDFMDKLDSNNYLLCFKNGVVDFKQKRFRKGQPDDFISKCTDVDYVKFDPVTHHSTMKEISSFMTQLFPIKELEEYMWSHLASVLIGENVNQTFNVYKGVGSNGKSKLTELMTKSLGSYVGNISIAFITSKRGEMGKASPEVSNLIGVRYAIMSEPSKGDRINEGVMKELTGGDRIQARALYKEVRTFTPQFKLVVTTNYDFEYNSNDDGTWRRLRYVDFKSKFVPHEPYSLLSRDEFPYQYKIDNTLEEKLNIWAPIFMSKLVELAYVNMGIVKDCATVMATSQIQRDSQDYLSGFIKNNIKKKAGSIVKKFELTEQFKVWYNQTHGKMLPKGKEIIEFMDKRFGLYKNGWHDIALIYDEEDPLEAI